MSPTSTRRVLTVLTVTLALMASLLTPAAAEPGDDEGGQPSLRESLDVALRDYNDAKGRLDASLVRQTKLAAEQSVSKTQLDSLGVEVNILAATAYRGSRVSMAVAVLGAGSPEALLRTAATVEFLTQRDDRQLRELTTAQRRYDEQQLALVAEIKLQQDQLAIMAKKKKDAEDALRKAGGGSTTSGVTAGKVTAKAAGRNPDGSWPRESCSVDDPTTSGCITPRMLNAYNEARVAGFTRYTSCHRGGSFGEHPKGRACDFSANSTGFVNARASGGDKAYGDRLAGWCIANASRIGVLYVIWYKQIWQPGSGWKSYGGDGTPAGDHYNHVHLSIQ